MPDPILICPGCDTEIAPNFLTCPNCHRLLYSDRLKELAEEATHASTPVEAMVAWRSALELLPVGTRQHETISLRLAELGRIVDASPTAMVKPAPPSGGGRWGGAAGLGAFALIAWKFKTIAFLIATKGKLLLLGLTKLSTLTSMMLSVGVYWTVFGWQLALGLVVSIYIHEMGHVAALLRYGVKASAPQFIPGLGAIIRLKQALGDPRQDARVGLAGPIWGLGACLASFAIWKATDLPIWAALAKLGAIVNLFNLIPLGSLDGGRVFRALDRQQRWLAVFVLAMAWSYSPATTTSGLLVLLLIGGVINAAGGKPAKVADPQGLLAYLAVVGLLCLLAETPDSVAGGL